MCIDSIKKVLVITFTALQGEAPAYITDLLQHFVASRSLRSSDQGLLVGSQSRLKTKGDFAFEFVPPEMWNSLPLDLTSADIFKKRLKPHLFRLSFV